MKHMIKQDLPLSSIAPHLSYHIFHLSSSETLQYIALQYSKQFFVDNHLENKSNVSPRATISPKQLEYWLKSKQAKLQHVVANTTTPTCVVRNNLSLSALVYLYQSAASFVMAATSGSEP